MQTQILYIDQDTGSVSAQCTSIVEPALFAVLGTTLSLSVAFTSAGTPAAITNYTAATLRIVVKPADDMGASTGLLPLGTWGTTGSGSSTRYTWIASADSVQLAADLGALTSAIYKAQIEWSISTDTNLRKSQPFNLLIINSPARLTDGVPDLTDAAAWDWFKARLVAGTNVTLTDNDGTQVTTIAAAAVLPTDPTFAYWTGSADTGTHATYTAATISDPPTQAEVQAIADALQHVSRGHAAMLGALLQGLIPGVP